MERNEFQNKAYKAMIGTLESYEHEGLIGNGHHLTQKLVGLLWDEFEGGKQ